jgi:hypothetical protein
MFASIFCDDGHVTSLPIYFRVGVKYFIINNQNLFKWLLQLPKTNYGKVVAKIFIISIEQLFSYCCAYP